MARMDRTRCHMTLTLFVHMDGMYAAQSVVVRRLINGVDALTKVASLSIIARICCTWQVESSGFTIGHGLHG